MSSHAAPHRLATTPPARRLLSRAVVGCAAALAVALTLVPDDAHAASRRRRASRARAARAAKARAYRAPTRMPLALRGSRQAVDLAYDAAVRDNVAFARSRAEIERGVREGTYVPLARATRAYRLSGVATPYVLPTTRAFVEAFGADYQRSCGEPLTVTSAMRPTSVHLANSVEKTVHPTGMAVDLRAPRRARCRNWMRSSLVRLEAAGVVNATEERRPPHFHVVVLRAP
jgi:hypothetical protein